MTFPKSELLLVSRQKVIDYLLNPEHRENGGKADFFMASGFTPDDWQYLAKALQQTTENPTRTDMVESKYGIKWVVEGMMALPRGGLRKIRTVWICEPPDQACRLVTAYPVD